MRGGLAALFAFALLWAAPARADDFYDIHVVASLTGGGAFLGMEEHDALLLVEKTVNKTGGIHGKKLRYVFHDDQSSPQIAVQLLNDVVALHPTVFMGSSLVATCNAMFPLVQDKGPVMYCFSAGIHPPAGSYVFVAGVSTHDQAIGLVRYFRLRGWTKLGIITSTDATGQDADKGFDELLAMPENKGVSVAAHEHFNTNDVSISAQIENVKAAEAPGLHRLEHGRALGLHLPRRGARRADDADGHHRRQHDLRADAPFRRFPAQGILSADGGMAGERRYRASSSTPRWCRSSASFMPPIRRPGSKPDEGSLLGWDPAIIVVDALRALPAGASAAQLHDYLIHLKGVAGANGIYDYDATPQRGLSLDDVVVTRWNPAADKWDVVTQPGSSSLVGK